jgi:protein-disulfide isomerase
MTPKRTVVPGAVGSLASLLGIFFAGFSTHDYALHLDRQLHGTHCSFIPGLVDASGGDNACTTAMYSAYSALFRATYWGGVPISLFALGAYAGFLGLGIYLIVGSKTASVRFARGYAVATVFPLLASIAMFVISLTQLGGSFCKLCVGLYVASILLFLSGVLAWRSSSGAVAASSGVSRTVPGSPYDADDPTIREPEPWGAVAGREISPARSAANRPVEPVSLDVHAHRPVLAFPPLGSPVAPLAVLLAIGLAAAAPAAVYVSSMPKVDGLLTSCGKLTVTTEKTGALIKVKTSSPTQPALSFEDPLCPTCRAFHQRLDAEGLLDQLDYTLVLFPLDNECNWMLDRPLHPGACTVSKALICADQAGQARAFLDWAYEEQDSLVAAGKQGKDAILARIRTRFTGLDACIDDKKTKQRLDAGLRFAVENKIRVSTPQLFLGDQRVCDEDTDLGLRYTFAKLAPRVK